MARKIITCTACKARFDVARYPPGSRVRCGRCSQVLTVPLDSPTTGSAAKRGGSGKRERASVTARADQLSLTTTSPVMLGGNAQR